MRPAGGRLFGLGAALVAVVAASCAPVKTVEPSQPPAQWQVSQATPLATPSARPAANSWKGIRPGATTRAEMDTRFGPGRPGESGSLIYSIDQIKVVALFDAPQTVRGLQMAPAITLTRQELTSKFGEPDRVQVLPGGASAFVYDAAGLTVAFRGFEPAGWIELDAARKPVDESSGQLLRALLPVRPPLSDLARRRTDMESVLSATSGGFSWVGREREWQQAAGVYEELSRQGVVLHDAELQEYLDGLMNRLSSTIPGDPSVWKLAVIKGGAPNAMNLGGGYILVTQGLIEQVDTEAQLAYVVSHEAAHQLKGHLAVTQTRSEIASVLVLAGGVAAGVFGGPDAMRAALDLGNAAAGVALSPFSRAQEQEADGIALSLVADAGYDPRQAAIVMNRLTSASSQYGATITALSPHPAPETRAADIQSWLAARGNPDLSGGLVTTQEFVAFRSRYRANRWD